MLKAFGRKPDVKQVSGSARQGKCKQISVTRKIILFELWYDICVDCVNEIFASSLEDYER